MSVKTELPPPQVIYQAYPEHEDEVDVGLLFSKIWFSRYFILASLFLAVVTTLGALATIYFFSPPVKQFSTILQFNFPSAEKGKYPSGQDFSSSDLISAKVLMLVYESNKLGKSNVNIDEFMDNLSVMPFSDSIEFIKAKYKDQLSNKKLSPPEITSLQNEFENELRSAQARFVRLTYTHNKLMGLDELTIQKVLSDIPRIWSEISIQELGVLDLKVSGTDFYQSQQVQRFDYIQAMDYMKASSAILAQALSELIADELGGFIRDPETGKTVYDIQAQLKSLVDFEIQPLVSTISNQGISKNSETAKIYLKNSIQFLKDKRSVMRLKAENYQTTLDIYNSKVRNSYEGVSSPETGTVTSGGFAQYDSSFLSKFTTLIEEKKDIAFKQDLLGKRLQLSLEIETINGKLVQQERSLAQFEKNESQISEKMIASLVSEVDYVAAALGKLISDYGRILRARNQHVLGQASRLYEVTNGKLIKNSGMISQLKRMILYSILAGFIALMVSIFIALIKKMPEQ